MSDSEVRRVVTTVHGTYAKHATWVEPDSKLGQALTQRYGAGVVVAPFRWNGRNNPSARAEAKDKLREHLHCMQQKYKLAQHYIVAHSHGGNVAFYALRDKSLRDAIAGVACLATPFLVSRPRVLGSKDMAAHVAGAVGLLLLVVQFLARWWLSAFEPAWLRELMIFAFLLLSMVLVAALLKNWRTFAESLHKALQLATLSKERLLIVRAPGDEASAALLFFQFVSQLSVRLYVLLYQLHERLLGLLKRWSGHRLRLLAALVGGFVLYVAVIICAILLKMSTGAIVAIAFLLAWLCMVVPALTLIGWIDVAAGPVQFMIGALLSAIIILLSITLLPFGWQVALSNILLDITAETTPPGTWEVNQIEPTHSQVQAGDVQPLQHSVVYDDPHSLTLICNWMERTEMTSHG